MLPLRSHALRRAALSTPRPCANCTRHRSTAAPEPTSAPTSGSKTVFSGIQPTGIPHLGNYLGALRQWVKLQNDASNDDVLLFSIVDLHALTIRQNPADLSRWRKEMLASLLAVGLDPQRSIIFAQSSVKQHAELMWLLSCNASMGYLGRMTQWKSKLSLADNANPLDPSPSNKAALKLGLFSYPVLQAADILLYRTTHVPVGEDQAQHLEFSREIALGCNHAYGRRTDGENLFVAPTTILSPAKRVMSLSDPTKKMSKSDPNLMSRILITDDKDTIHKKIRSALTDNIVGVSYDRALRPGVSNLVEIMYYMDESVVQGPEELANELKDLSMRALKDKVAHTIDATIRDVRGRYEDFMNSGHQKTEDLAVQGCENATIIAERQMEHVRKAVGISWGS